jgi:hypothetical protein
MNEKYFTSLELSQRLKDLGIEQKSEWYWKYGGRLSGPWLASLISKKEYETPSYGSADSAYSFYSAFHVGELGTLLREEHIDQWYSYPEFRLKLKSSITPDARNEREAEARGLMLAYLKEKGLI